MESNKRLISSIARDILNNWNNPSFSALPYLKAMLSLSDINDIYIMESAREVIQRFLCNASGFKGDSARSIKKELKELLKS